MKMPEPIIDPATTIVESYSPKPRLNSVSSPSTDAGGAGALLSGIALQYAAPAALRGAYGFSRVLCRAVSCQPFGVFSHTCNTLRRSRVGDPLATFLISIFAFTMAVLS